MATADPTEQHIPSYVKIARLLHEKLASMNVNERLVSERQLCVEWEVSRVTLRRAMQSFYQEGILDSRRGGGTWLVRPVPPLAQERARNNRLIGVVVPSVENPMIARLVRGMEKCTADLGFHMTLTQDYGNIDYQITQLKRIAESDVAGVIVYPDTANFQRDIFRDLLREIEQRIPLVMVDRHYAGGKVSCVLSDNFAGMYSATEHMILSGYRRLGLLGFGEEGSNANRDRRRGFLTALRDYGLGSQPVMSADLGVQHHEVSARQVVREWLANGRGIFDGLVCMQDNMAYGAFLALKEAGIDVPSEVGLIGYDNLDRETFRASGLHLTSIDQPSEQIGHEAVRILIEKVTHVKPSTLARHLLLPPQLILRSSCGTGSQTEIVKNTSPESNILTSPVSSS